MVWVKANQAEKPVEVEKDINNMEIAEILRTHGTVILGAIIGAAVGMLLASRVRKKKQNKE